MSLFHTATKILLAFISRAAWQLRYYSTKVGLWRKDFLEGHAFFYFNFFCERWLHDSVTLQIPCTYICICNRVRSVPFSDGGLRDRDIIFKDETDLVFCFLSCLVKFPALEANSWQRRASSNPGNPGVSSFSIFLRSNAHTHTKKESKVRRHAERPKGDREQFASLDFWLKCFTRLGTFI